MKKHVLIEFLIFIVSISSLFANEDTVVAVPKVSERKEVSGTYDYRFFRGFEFEDYVPSTIGLLELIKAEEEQIIKNDLKKGNNEKKYAIVGHSQGGPRVLGYATYMKQRIDDEENAEEQAKRKKEYEQIQAVITISGINKGLQALYGGLGRVTAEINRDIRVVYKGTLGVLSAGIFSGFVVHGYEDGDDYSATANQVKIRKWIINDILPDGVANYIRPAFDDPVNLDNMGEIRDMMPRSDYLKNYVSTTTDHRYKVQTGTEKVWRWKKGLCGIRYYWYEFKPVYTTYTSTEDVANFPADMPVGYIVGLKSNTLSIMGPELEEKVRDSFDTAEIVCNIAGGFHIYKACCIVGLFSGSIGYSNDCFNAAEWFGDIDGDLDRLLGAKEHDGLVAKANQYFPKTFTDPNTKEVRPVHDNVICSDKMGYKAFPQYNHASIESCSDSDDSPVAEEIKYMLVQAENIQDNALNK